MVRDRTEADRHGYSDGANDYGITTGEALTVYGSESLPASQIHAPTLRLVIERLACGVCATGDTFDEPGMPAPIRHGERYDRVPVRGWHLPRHIGHDFAPVACAVPRVVAELLDVAKSNPERWQLGFEMTGEELLAVLDPDARRHLLRAISDKMAEKIPDGHPQPRHVYRWTMTLDVTKRGSGDARDRGAQQ